MTTQPQTGFKPLNLRAFGALDRAEWGLLALVAIVGAGAVVLAETMDRVVNWAGFAPGIAAALGLVALGAYARQAKGAERLGLGAMGVGLFMGFTAVASIFIFALFPLHNPLIDGHLAAWDASLGYDWAGFVGWLAQWPLPASALGYLYHSSVPQMVLLIILLAAWRQDCALLRFLAVGMGCMIVTVAFWWLWPSIGPSATATLAPEVAARIGLVFSPAAGAELLRLVAEGPGVIGPETVMGVVAFPSYHIIMALMVAWFSWRTWAFWPFALAGLGMIPATLAHGGHHLVDLMAGTVVFLGVVIVVARIIPATQGK